MEHRGKPEATEAAETVEDAPEPGIPQKNKGFGFVQYALEDDAMKALEALKTGKFLGRKLKGELAMRKHVKFDSSILSQELPKAHAIKKAAGISAKAAVVPRSRPSNKVEITFLPAEDGKALPEFNKKQLYKKVRKVAEFTELEYPVGGDASKAVAHFASVPFASKAIKKLDKHVFKGAKMSARMVDGPANAPSGSATTARSAPATNSVKAHRLIIRNLPFSITSQALDEHFRSFGKILEIVLPTKPGSTALRGFAFVQYEEREAAVLAMAATNGKEIAGRTVAVDWAVGKTLYEQIVKSEQQPQEEAEAEEDESEYDGSDSEDDGVPEHEMDADHVPEDEEEEVEEEQGDKTMGSSAAGSTVFIRNIGFETSQQAIEEKFSRFGSIEYCKLVVNPQTGASRGTAFIKFKSPASALTAIKASSLLSQDSVAATSAFNNTSTGGSSGLATQEESLDELKRKRAGKAFRSVLVDNDAAVEDPEQGGILLDGRALSVVAAVDRDSAHKLKLVEQTEKTDKRRLGLLQESQLKPATPVASKFWSAEDVKERQAMIKARLNDLRKNANSIVSEVRLSVRHLPTAVTEDQLRQVIEHAMEEALKHSAQVLSDNPVHKDNAERVKPRLKQVKIVRATGEEKESRAGRSKGFGFVEFTQPSHALLVLRYLTNNIPDIWYRQLPEVFGRRLKHGGSADKKEKKAVVLAKGKPVVPVVEFAIDKVAVLAKTGAVENKKQVHKKTLEKPTTGKPPKRPGFNQKQQSKNKRPRN